MSEPPDRAFIRDCLPHGEGMCLLDAVLEHSAEHVVCGARVRADHPLACDGALHAVHAVEYAAQATAVHGALLDGGGARPGVIASVRSLTWERATLRGERLTVRCDRVLQQPTALVYDFELTDADGAAVRGRVTLAFPEAR